MRVPKNAKKVFEGVIFDVYQWEQKMFDGTTETFEKLKRANTVEIIATQGDKIIMAKESQPDKLNFYTLFSGRLEKDEDALDGAKRELKEESGLESNDWEKIKTYEPYTKLDWKIYLFIARNCKKTAEQDLDSGEKIKILEVSFDEFIDIVLNKNFRGKEIIEEVLRLKVDGKLDELKNKIFNKKTD